MKTQANPFTNIRYAVCEECCSGFNANTGTKLPSLPDNCDGVVLHGMRCGTCWEASGMSRGSLSQVGLVLMGACLAAIGLLVLGLMVFINH